MVKDGVCPTEERAPKGRLPHTALSPSPPTSAGEVSLPVTQQGWWLCLSAELREGGQFYAVATGVL